MNLKEYIESGILESYALGELDARQRQEVEAHVAMHAELRKELQAIEEATQLLIMKSGRSPLPGLKERILKSAQGGKQIKLDNSKSQMMMWKYATAASLLMAVATSTLSYIFWSNWKRTETDLQDRIALSQRMAEDLNQVNQRLDKIEQDLTIYDNPLFTRVIMKGTANAPSALASVYWNQKTQEVFLSIQDLKELTQDRQYQLWAIVDGKPVDMGVIGELRAGLIKMNRISRASAFAITIEPSGGKTTPTLETMQVLGNT